MFNVAKSWKCALFLHYVLPLAVKTYKPKILSECIILMESPFWKGSLTNWYTPLTWILNKWCLQMGQLHRAIIFLNHLYILRFVEIHEWKVIERAGHYYSYYHSLAPTCPPNHFQQPRKEQKYFNFISNSHEKRRTQFETRPK